MRNGSHYGISGTTRQQTADARFYASEYFRDFFFDFRIFAQTVFNRPFFDFPYLNRSVIFTPIYHLSNL